MYSKEHIKYLNKIKKEKFLIKICQILILALFIITWQYLADKKIINTFIFSSPIRVLKCIYNLRNQNLFSHIIITIWETLISFTIGTILGIAIATIMWWNKFISKVIDPYLTVINSLPKVALGPIIIIWAGAGMKSIIIMTLLISVIVTTLSVYQGFKEVDSIKIKLLNSFNATKMQTYTNLIFPISIPCIINALKINISMSLIGVIMGEFLVSKKGIGYLIIYGSQVFNLDLVISGILILCLVAVIMYKLIVILEKLYIKKYE